MLKMNKEVIEAIVAHAKREAPLEACGYLAGKDGIAVMAYPLTNADASEDHFSLKPEEQFAAVRQMRAAGMRLCAMHHSHPCSEAKPSAEDIRLAYDPEISYVIVSLSGKTETVRSFKIQGSVVEKEEVEILG
ncbi:MAG: M67 family metallopeptidase [Syntrophales bacterium]|nr:M67 family metallopeptidase [Syntrophales bacterium]